MAQTLTFYPLGNAETCLLELENGGKLLFDYRKLLHAIAEYTFTQSSPGCMMIIGESHFSIYLKSI